MDVQDAMVFGMSLLGALGAIGILSLQRPRRLWLRIVLMLVLVFVSSSIAQMIGRLVFGVARGVDFSRAFLDTGVGISIYLCARIYQHQRNNATPGEDTHI